MQCNKEKKAKINAMNACTRLKCNKNKIQDEKCNAIWQIWYLNDLNQLKDLNVKKINYWTKFKWC